MSDTLLQSVLDEVSRPGEAVRNVLRGNFKGAARNLIDLADRPLNLLPGVNIKELATDEDKPSGGDLIGLHDPSLAKTAADVGIGVLTNPLSLLALKRGRGLTVAGKTVAGAGKTIEPVKELSKAASAVSDKAAEAVDKGINAYRQKVMATTSPVSPAKDILVRGRRIAKNALGWADLSEDQRAQLDRFRAVGQMHGKSAADEVKDLFKGTTSSEQVALGDAFDALHWHQGMPVGLLAGSVHDRLRALHSIDPTLRLPVMHAAAERMERLTERMLKNETSAGARKNIGHGREDYLMRQHHRPVDVEFADPPQPGAPSTLKSRQLETPADLRSYLLEHQENGYERNALRRMSDRAMQHGRLMEKAAIGKTLRGDFVNLPDSGALVKETIASLPPDMRARMTTAFGGMAPRGYLLNALSTANRWFKPAVTSGLAMPRLGFIVKNSLGNLWGAFSTPGVGLATQKHALSHTLEGIDDGIEQMLGSRIGDTLRKGVNNRPPLTKSLNAIDEAYRQSHGDGHKVTAYLRKHGREDLAQAVEHSVTENFVSTEDLAKQIFADNTGWHKKASDIINAPAAMMNGVDQRFRLGMFLDLRDKYGPAKAAQLTKDALLDYSVSGPENRTLRDLVPFSQFVAQSIPQQSKFLAAAPAVAVGLAPLLGGHGSQLLYPSQANMTAVPIGNDEKGSPQIITSLGIPTEVLNSIPTDARGAEALLGQTQPLIKSAYGLVSGRDPTFGTPFGSYDREPITGNHSELGRGYQELAGTGLIAPISMPVNQVSQLLDDRRSPGAKVFQFLTGARIASVDPELARREQLQEVLSRDPNAKSFTTYYSGGSPETQAAIDELKTVAAKLKAKRAQGQPDAAEEAIVSRKEALVTQLQAARQATLQNKSLTTEQRTTRLAHIDKRLEDAVTTNRTGPRKRRSDSASGIPQGGLSDGESASTSAE